MNDTAERFWEAHYSGRERVFGGEANPLLVETAPSLTPGTALDLGCGEGGDAVWLATQGWQVRAVDVSATALRRTAAHAADAGTQVATEHHDLSRTFPAGEFDLVSAQYFHTPLEFPRARVLSRAAHALTVGGVLLVVDHGSVSPWSWADPETRFPAPEDVFAELGLHPSRWRAERLDTPQRQATGPGGRTAIVTDTVVTVRRLAT